MFVSNLKFFIQIVFCIKNFANFSLIINKSNLKMENSEQNSENLSKDSPQNNPQKALNKDIPTLEEFLKFAKTLNSYDDSLDENLKSKYEEWSEKGWKNNFGRPITDWKSTIKNTMPYLKNRSSKNIDSIQYIPNIRRSGIEKV